MGKREWTAVLYLILTSVLVGLGIWRVGRPPERLSEERIGELRGEYPVYTEFCPPLMDMKTPALDELIDLCDCFVYGEFIGEPERRVRWGSLVGVELRESYCYPFRVIADTEGYYEPGEVLLVEIDGWWADYKPQPRTGLRMVFGSYESRETPGETGYMAIGTYYVTEEGYVLAAFPENERIMGGRGDYTGLKVEHLLKRLRKRG